MHEDTDNIAEAHRAGIDMDYRAPDKPDEVRESLPMPIIETHPEWIELYWRTWSIAYNQVREPAPETGLVPYCDAAFSHNLFQWDTCFMERFLRYAPEQFMLYGSLDNFYRKQHDDGFICREINSISGADFWEKTHPSSVNPPLFSDAEWSLYNFTNDKNRLRDVLGPLHRYHQWLNANRRTTDGVGYWTTALGSGMDNSPRAYDQGGQDVHDPYGYTWMCMTAQQALSARRISQIATEVEEYAMAGEYQHEFERLAAYVHRNFWNDRIGCYADQMPDGNTSDVLTPAMCWPLLLSGVPRERAERVASLLRDPARFWRKHAIPSLSADDERYNSKGNYWCGSVWPPMVYLAARAMHATGHHDLAADIAVNHLENLTQVYRDTGTFWENYAPDSSAPGQISRPEFVGWTGCGPIAMLIESVVGLSVSAPRRQITWRLSRNDEHGVTNLPMGADKLDLIYSPRDKTIKVRSDDVFDLVVEQHGQRTSYQGLRGSTGVRLT